MPMTRLPLIGTISYNGCDFDAQLDGVNAPVEARYVYDRAGRVITHVEYTISVKGVVSADKTATSIDEYMSYFRRALSQPGGNLRFTARGFGLTDFQVNRLGGQIWDVDWGPKPQLLSWKALGGGRAAEFTWRCVTCIPECPGGPNTTRYKGGIKEVNYSWQVALDRAGMATLTINGYAVIPQTRASVSDNRLQDTADRILEACVNVVPCPVGFERTNQSHQIDESKNRITWTTVYKELGQIPLPSGVVECRASHEISSSLEGGGFARWDCTITASYTLDKNYRKDEAVLHFGQLVRQRRNWSAARNLGQNNTILTGFTARDSDIYGPAAADFTCRYWLISSLFEVIAKSGLWMPHQMANQTWPIWRLSLRNGALHPRGFYKLGLPPAQDVLVNLCKPGAVQVPVRQPPVVVPGFPNILLAPETPIAPEVSWVFFAFLLEWEEDDGVIEHAPLDDEAAPGQTPPPAPLPDPGSSTEGWTPEMWQLAEEYGKYVQGGGKLSWQDWLVKVKGYKPPQGNKYPQGHGPRYSKGTLRTFQQGRPGQSIILTGRAVRVGYPIDCPWVAQVGGVPVTRANRPGVEFFRQGVAANAYGVPIYYAEWRQRYVFPTPPQRGVVPPVPQPNWSLPMNPPPFMPV